MPFAKKRQKSRHPLAASSSQSFYIRNPKPGTGGYTRASASDPGLKPEINITAGIKKRRILY